MLFFSCITFIQKGGNTSVTLTLASSIHMFLVQITAVNFCFFFSFLFSFWFLCVYVECQIISEFDLSLVRQVGPVNMGEVPSK